jgi:hypothetical protein
MIFFRKKSEFERTGILRFREPAQVIYNDKGEEAGIRGTWSDERFLQELDEMKGE